MYQTVHVISKNALEVLSYSTQSVLYDVTCVLQSILSCFLSKYISQTCCVQALNMLYMYIV